jgi:hypothetical protein
MNDSIDEGRVVIPSTYVDLAAAIDQHDGSGSSLSNTDAGVSHFPPVPVIPAKGRAVFPAARAESAGPSVETLAARSPVDDWRIALHEAGHVIVGRALGCEVAGVTIVPSGNYGGLTWGPMHVRSEFDGSAADDIVVPDLCEKIGSLMPGDGEPRVNAAEIYAHVQVRVTDLCAGTASESLLYPDDEPWIAHSDVRQARALASIICTSEAAIDAYLLFGLASAKALIMQHRAAVIAIAEALMIERTLSSEQIDTIIASAPERARRADWAGVLNGAADFFHQLSNDAV